MTRFGNRLRHHAVNYRSFAHDVTDKCPVGQVWDLSRLIPSAGSVGAAGVIGVLDSGIPDHPMLSHLMVGSDVGEAQQGQDTTNHATASCGLITAACDAIKGLLPDARVVPIKVTDDAGDSSDTSIAAGILCAAVSGATVVVVTPRIDQLTPPLEAALAKVREHEVLVVMDIAVSEGLPGNVLNVHKVNLPDEQGWVPHGPAGYCRIRTLDFVPVIAGAYAAQLSGSDDVDTVVGVCRRNLPTSDV